MLSTHIRSEKLSQAANIKSVSGLSFKGSAANIVLQSVYIVSGVLRLMYEMMDGQVRYTLQNMGTHTLLNKGRRKKRISYSQFERKG